MPEAGWYQDPSGKAPFRWWDGENWLEETTDNPSAPPSFYRQEPEPPSGFNMAPRDMPNLGYQMEPEQPSQNQYPASNPFNSEPSNSQNESSSPFGGSSPFAQNEIASSSSSSPAPWDTVGTSSQQQNDFAQGQYQYQQDQYQQDQYAQNLGQQNYMGGQSFGQDAAQYEEQSPYQSSAPADTIGMGKLPWEVEDDGTEEVEETESFFEQRKKLIMIVGGAFVAILLIYFFFLRGGGQETADSTGGGTSQTSEGTFRTTTTNPSSATSQPNGQGFQVTELPSWSLWPNTYGYAVKYPSPPQANDFSDRRVYTSSGTGYQYQLIERYLGAADVAAATIEQRLDILNALLAVSEPTSSVEAAEASSLGGIPARKFTLVKEDGSRYSAIASFTADRLFLLIGQGPETDRFYESFMWFAQPAFAPPAPQ